MADYYPEENAGAGAGAGDDMMPAGEGAAPPEGQEQETQAPEGGATALIPKTLLGGKEFQVGEEVTMKIVRDHGDEVEIAYATGEEKEPAESAAKPEMAMAEDKLQSMAA